MVVSSLCFVASKRHKAWLHQQLFVRNGHFLSFNGDKPGPAGIPLVWAPRFGPPCQARSSIILDTPMHSFSHLVRRDAEGFAQGL